MIRSNMEMSFRCRWRGENMAAKVLIVEDDPMLALDLRHEVEGLGF